MENNAGLFWEEEAGEGVGQRKNEEERRRHLEQQPHLHRRRLVFWEGYRHDDTLQHCRDTSEAGLGAADRVWPPGWRLKKEISWPLRFHTQNVAIP